MNLKRPYTIDLSAQMAVCDANYIKILQILPGYGMGVRREICFTPQFSFRTKPDAYPSTVIEVIERFKYTSTVRISHSVPASAIPFKAPEMLIRMYHDAKTSEVISYQQVRYIKARYELPNTNMYQADEKEQINFLLSEWLSYCQREGLCTSQVLAEILTTRTAA